MKKILLAALMAAVVTAVVFAAAHRRPAGVVTGESLLLTEPRFKTQVRTEGGLAGGPRGMPVTAAEGGERALDVGNISSYAIKDDIHPIEVITPQEMIFKAALWIAGIAGALLALFAAAALYLGREKKATPPDVEARVSLRALGGEVEARKIAAKDFYSKISRILASYLIGRYSLSGSEMTRTQILAALEAAPEAAGFVKSELEGMLARADSVRYFGGDAGVEDMKQDIEKVRGLIEATRLVDSQQSIVHSKIEK